MSYWKLHFNDYQKLFSSGIILKVLVSLSQQENKKACASDISKLLDIHKTTAKKFLEILSEYPFVDKTTYSDKPGKPTYYTLNTDEIKIVLDLTYLSNCIQDEETIPNPVIREKPDIQPDITYVLTKEGLIEEIMVRKRTKARRYVKQRFGLSNMERNFMKYLPHPAMQAKPFLEVCKSASISDHFAIKQLLLFKRKLQKLGILEEINPI